LTLSVRIFSTDRSCLLLLVAVALMLCGTGLAGRDLWDPDEPRSALVASSLLGPGPVAVPTLDGQPYLEKPPLYYWLVALAALPSGRIDPWSARLPSNLAAIATCLAVFYLGRSLYGRRAGTLAGIVLLTTFDVFQEARWARPDMLLTLLLTVAALAFWRAVQPEAPRMALPAFYLSTGLAILAKGPLGLLPGIAGLVYLAAVRQLGFLRRAGWTWGVPVILFPAALWIAAWTAATGEAFPVMALLGRLATRVGHGLHHAHPMSEMASGVPLALFPWVLILPAACFEIFPRPGQRSDTRSIYLFSFLLSYLALFTMSVEKRGVYLLPILPFQALLVGRLWDHALFDWDPPTAVRPIRWGLLAGLAIVLGGCVHYLPPITQMQPDLIRPAVALAVAGLLAFLLPALLLSRIGPGRALGLFAAGIGAAYLIVSVAVLPALNPYKSARPFAARVAAQAGGSPLGIFPDPHAGLTFYAGRPIVVLPTESELSAFLHAAPPVFCLVEESTYRDVTAATRAAGRVIDAAQVGHRRFLLVEGGVDAPHDDPGAAG
jgi:4-amino-4-deoxy-L-arabinose transferase-like glycosyltransferase